MYTLKRDREFEFGSLRRRVCSQQIGAETLAYSDLILVDGAQSPRPTFASAALSNIG